MGPHRPVPPVGVWKISSRPLSGTVCFERDDAQVAFRLRRGGRGREDEGREQQARRQHENAGQHRAGR